ncbi:mRNA interferase YafQ [hydrothermal vent metagenome]|uniref:mRNA interferase YafQ n=1 Tax=hydrothermal vent metagenome TaxID=652676 RepID=A0A3B0ZEF8_9ZZZZ
MLRIERTGRFKRDYKRELKGRHQATLETTFVEILKDLIANQPLAEKHWDHALTGDWKDHRDCHIKPDLVLIYRKPDDEVLQLVRLGSHSELGL